MANDPEYWQKLHAKIAGPATRYAVHAYNRQVWAGTNAELADRIVRDYAQLGQRAYVRKHR